MNALRFVGREEEIKALLISVRAGRGVVLAGPPGYGKSALLEHVRPVLAELAVLLWAHKLAPFGAFLKTLFRELWRQEVGVEGMARSKDVEADLKTWGKHYPSNEEKAKSLVGALERFPYPVVLVVDDASQISASMVPWLILWAERCSLVFALYPETLHRSQTKRLWTRFDRVDLGPLRPPEARALAEATVEGQPVPDPAALVARLVSLSGGIPGELVRLAGYLAAEPKTRAAGEYRAAGQERGFALAPVLLVLGGAGLVVRTLGLARGEMDVYVGGAVMVALFVIAAPWLRKAVIAK